jgi:signal transduction histidine kinase
VSAKKPGILDPLRVRIRRAQFIMGLGFIALVVGNLFTGTFVFRLASRIQDLPLAIRIPVVVSVESLWLLGVLPLLCYGAARVLELKPLSTALGSAFTGVVFSQLIIFVSSGLAGLWTGWLMLLLKVAALAGGVLLTHRAVVKGRAAAERASVQAKAQAEAKKVEYLEFLREAERAGEKTAQREAERVAVAASAGGAVESAAPVPTEPAPTAPASTDSPAAGADAPVETKTPSTGS